MLLAAQHVTHVVLGHSRVIDSTHMLSDARYEMLQLLLHSLGRLSLVSHHSGAIATCESLCTYALLLLDWSQFCTIPSITPCLQLHKEHDCPARAIRDSS